MQSSLGLEVVDTVKARLLEREAARGRNVTYYFIGGASMATSERGFRTGATSWFADGSTRRPLTTSRGRPSGAPAGQGRRS